MNPQPKRLTLAVAAALALACGAASAQSATPSDNATVNLIRLLVQQGVLKKDQADALVKQAEAEAVQARKTAATAAAAVPAAAAAGAAVPGGDVHVQYVPQVVRDQIREQVKSEVVAQAKAENWAQPNTFPDWVSRITVEGDMRVRDESDYYSPNNSNQITDFAALNRNGPYDVNTNTNNGFPPLLNTRQNRTNQLKVRARLGVRADLSDSWTAGIRLASGNDDNPVSTTQALGADFGKKDVWLDLAYLTYRPTDWATVTGGRIENPFLHTNLLYSDDLNFDGIAAIFKRPLAGTNVELFGTLGAFPLEYTSNSSTNSVEKDNSNDKWLLAAQVGANWKINSENSLKGALAYYNFANIAGQRSSPCAPWAGDTECSTDNSRPDYMQKGNTVFLLRENVPNPANAPGQTPDPQFVGLASKFNLLDTNLIWDTRAFGDMKLRLQGEYVRNLAYNAGDMAHRAEGIDNVVDNRDSDGNIQSGGNAWMTSVTFGKSLAMAEKGDWNVFAGYKYIQPDSMPDAYNDPTFHLGGTNAKGYYLGVNYAFDKWVYGTARWISAREIYGAPLQIDTMQLEVNARF
jgi:hypothetical protein